MQYDWECSSVCKIDFELAAHLDAVGGFFENGVVWDGSPGHLEKWVFWGQLPQFLFQRVVLVVGHGWVAAEVIRLLGFGDEVL